MVKFDKRFDDVFAPAVLAADLEPYRVDRDPKVNVPIDDTDGGLPRFVRGLVGLDREAAKRAFTQFLDGRRLNANQLEFLDLVIDHLTDRGVMDPRLLYEAPFTDFDRNGVEGVFEQSDVIHLVQILRDIEPSLAA